MKKTYQSTLNVKSSKKDAGYLFNHEKYDEALKICNHDLKQNPKDLHVLNIKALILTHFGKYREAIEIFDEALKLSDSHEIVLNKANALYVWAKKLHFPQYNNEQALDVINDAIELLGEDDDSSEFWFLKAEILEGLGDNIEARKCYFKAHGQLDELEKLENELNSIKKYSNDTLVSITGYNFYKGIEPFKSGCRLNLIKDPDNEHDPDAIAAILDDEIVGYVANSEYLVIDEVKSASEIKHLFKSSIEGEVLFIYLNEIVVVRLLF